MHRARGLAFVASLILLLPVRAFGSQEAGCAGSTPEETWAAARAAFAAEDLAALARCVAPESRFDMMKRLFSISGQLLQLMSLTTAEEGTPEYEADVESFRAANERLLGIERRHGLPTDPEEIAALDAEARQAKLAAIDHAAMISDLILFIESLEEDDSLQPGRGLYFTMGSLDHDLLGVRIEGDTARAQAGGAFDMVRVDGLWYLVPPE